MPIFSINIWDFDDKAEYWTVIPVLIIVVR